MKRSRGGRKKRWLGYLLSFLLGGLLAIGGYLYVSTQKPSPPETVDQKTIAQKIFIIDQTINSQLYDLGLPRRNIAVQFSEKKEGNIAWKKTVVKVQSPRSLSFSTIEESLKKAITLLGSPFSIRSIQTSESLHLDVLAFDRVTHELIFIPAQPPSPRAALPPHEPVPPKTTSRPMIAIVIDDIGEDNQAAQELMGWSVPITLAILPFTSHARSLALEAHRKSREVILHLPMEPHDYPKAKPGKGVLLHDMDKERLRRQLQEDIEAVPFVRGVSNHMGSRLMEDPGKVKVILLELKKRNLFFLDSRTTPQTVGFRTARSLGMKSAERSVFLDHSQGEEAVKRSLQQLIHRALSTGKAIGVGHPHASTIKSLQEMIPRIQEKGIEIVPLSSLVE